MKVILLKSKRRVGARKNDDGFSMIEVLVASTIMITLMLMLGMLFQQTSQAWRTGRQRADVLIKARSFFGFLQRDVSAAIDMYTLPQAMQDALGKDFTDLKQNFSSSELQFFTLTGSGFESLEDEKNKSRPSLRALTHVHYTSSGSRTETVILSSQNTYGGFQQDQLRIRNTQILNSGLVGAQLTGVQFNAYRLENNNATQTSGQIPLPAYITIQAKATATTNTWEIGAASAGPDRQWDTKDDIRTWVE